MCEENKNLVDNTETVDEYTENTCIRSPDELYNYLNSQTKWLIENVEYFKDFLIAASIIDKSCGELGTDNKLLIYNQNIDARYLYTKEVWEDMGYQIKEGSYPILILREIKDKSYKDKSKLQYIVKELYDVLQIDTDYPKEPRFLFSDLGEAAEGIIRVKPCELTFSVIAAANRFAYYNSSENKIAVTNGCKSYDSLFSDIACEYAHYEFARIKTENYLIKAQKEGFEPKEYKYQRKSHLFEAECAAYALSMMYGVGPGNYDMPQVHQKLFNMSPEEVREELDLILKAISRIDDRLQNLLTKEKNMKE